MARFELWWPIDICHRISAVAGKDVAYKIKMEAASSTRTNHSDASTFEAFAEWIAHVHSNGNRQLGEGSIELTELERDLSNRITHQKPAHH